MSKFAEVWKSTHFTKPGAGTHSAKFDRCVASVKKNTPGADAYAVCTSVLGDEAISKMDDKKFDEVLDKALGSFGIANAGPIPESKLSRQNLEGSSLSKSSGFTPRDYLIERMRQNQKKTVSKGSSFREAWAAVKPR